MDVMKQRRIRYLEMRGRKAVGQVNYAYGAVEERQLRTDNVVEERIASSYNPQSRDALLPTEVLVECRDTFIERTKFSFSSSP